MDLFAVIVLTGVGGWYSLSRFGSPFSAIGIFSVCWGAGAILFLSGIVPYDPPTGEATTLIIIAFPSFWAGSLAAEIIVNQSAANIPPLSPRASDRAPLLLHFVLLIGVFASIYQAYRLISAGGAELLNYFSDAYERQDELYISGVGLAHQAVGLVPAFAIVLYSADRIKNSHAAAIGAIALAATILSANKLAFIQSALIAVIVAAIVGKLRVKAFVLGVAGLLAFVALFSYAKAPGFRGDHRFWVRDGFVHLPRLLAPLSVPVVYVSGSYAALDMYINDETERVTDGGEGILRPFLVTAAKVVPLWEAPQVHGKSYATPIPVNTFTFLRRAIEAAGTTWALLYPLVLGVLCSLVYLLVLWRHRLELAVPFGVVGAALVVCFFSDHFVYVRTWWLFLCALVLSVGMHLRSEQPMDKWGYAHSD